MIRVTDSYYYRTHLRCRNYDVHISRQKIPPTNILGLQFFMLASYFCVSFSGPPLGLTQEPLNL